MRHGAMLTDMANSFVPGEYIGNNPEAYLQHGIKMRTKKMVGAEKSSNRSSPISKILPTNNLQETLRENSAHS